ncbi:MAG: InlB B-repeat-containing protein, partial [Kosmotogaceae bacterium]
FVNWTENGVQVSANTTYSFTVTANRTLVANFRLKTYTITATAGAGGSIDPSGDVSVNHGDDQAFAITPDEGYNVEDVLIDGESVGLRTSYTFTGVASDHTIHASFSLLPPPTYTVTFNVSDNQGAVQGASVTFYGETKATDAQGKAMFTGVLAGNRVYTVIKTGYNNATGNVNVDGDETVNVILTKKTYTITATAGAGGNINPAGNVQVEHGSNRLFNITPNTGYEIDDVKVDGVSIGAVSTYNFTNVTTNHTIHATFRLKSYTIAVSANPPAGGNVSGGGNYTHGDTVNLVATANEGYEFVNLTENGVQVSANTAYSFTATANRTLVANFRLKTYTITATAGAGGNINPSGNVNVTHGSNQSFAITPNTGYDIEDVKVDGISVGAVSSYTFNNVTANHTIAATFKLKTYTLTTHVVGQGTVTKNPDKSKYNHGEVVQLTANPSAGWAFNTWSGDLSGSANPANLTMNGNKTVTANFVRVYTVTFNVSDNQGSVQSASVTFNGETKNTNASGQAVFTNVQSGTRSYTISKTGYNNATGNVNVDGDKTVNVTLTKKTYTIAVSANPAAGGTASGGGVYTHGDTVNLSATPKEGYRFVNWTENGAQVSTNASYSFTATKNRTLVANFTTISKGTIQINNTTMDGFGQIDIYAEDFEFGVTAIEYVLSFDTTKLSVLAMSNDAGLGWSLANMIRNTGGIIHFIAGGQPVNLAGRTKIATIVVSEISSGSTTIGFTSYVYNDSPVETAVADDSQPPQEIRSPNITLIPGTITIN